MLTCLFVYFSTMDKEKDISIITEWLTNENDISSLNISSNPHFIQQQQQQQQQQQHLDHFQQQQQQQQEQSFLFPFYDNAFLDENSIQTNSGAFNVQQQQQQQPLGSFDDAFLYDNAMQTNPGNKKKMK